MKKFEDILIVSDWDGTLFSRTVTEENIKAIKYFQQNGGKFTIASGRYHEYLRKYRHLVAPNTYVISVNGAIISKEDTNDYLYCGTCDETLFPILEKILSFDIYNKIFVYFEGDDDSVEFNIRNFHTDFSQYRDRKIHKVLLTTDIPEKGDLGVILANELDLGDYIAVRSWHTSLEILHKNNSKGASILRLKEKITPKLTIAVGDYENDLSMFEVADISYAVENACDIVKQTADRITTSVTTTSIAEIINQLDKEL